ncbi:nickel ABC transporter substrate-binding protein [Heyndrickxia sp. NPDC080065]|uniref:nickel ABC transporter substrate-binding protein n=1 Tax=Heyndrickxia sp. NPDC080065 TaxID=3390568 RepID=UPI003CFFA34D
MKQQKNGLFFCLMFAALFIILAGCSSSDANKAEQKKEKDVLTVSWPRDVAEMNPHVYNPSQMFAQTMIYEPLIGYGENGELVPKLAESWDVSKDGKTYTFHIRNNVQFSDGSTLDASIIKRNFDEILRQTKENGTHTWLTVLTKIDKVSVVDDHTLKMILKEPYYATLQELAVARPVRILGAAGFPKGDDTSKGVKKAVGTGPWILDKYKTDEYAIFKRNDNYWGELPKVKEIKVKIIPDSETSVLALEKGDIDLIIGEGAINTDTFKELEKSDQFKTQISKPYATRQLVMNTTRDTLSDIRVREALNMAFDKNTMVKTITAGMEEKADNLLSTNLPYTANIKPEHITYNQEKAAKLLDEAGWTLKDGATTREKDGKPLEIELMYNSAETIQKTMAETLQSEWATVGVKLNLVSEELGTQVKRFKANDFDINFFSSYGTPYDPHTFVNIVANDGYGYSAAIKSYDKKQELINQINEVLSSTDEKKRQQLYTEIFTTLQNQYSIVPISYINKIAVYQKNVKGLQFAPNRDEHSFNNIELQ